MIIYFAGAIAGGREHQSMHEKIIEHLKQYGEVLTEHVGDRNISQQGETHLSDTEIYDRDLAWLSESDVIVAEVSTPSLGVGYEISKAEGMNKKILCLFQIQEGKRLSAMVRGNNGFVIEDYESVEQALEKIDSFFKKQK